MIEKLPIYNQRKFQIFVISPQNRSHVHHPLRWTLQSHAEWRVFSSPSVKWFIPVSNFDMVVKHWCFWWLSRLKSHAHSVGLSSLEYTVKSSQFDFTLAGRKGEFSSFSFKKKFLSDGKDARLCEYDNYV